MGSVSTPPVEQARSIFDQLGYTISSEEVNSEFRAERGWKVVRVIATSDLVDPPEEFDDELGCFVTYRETGNALDRYIRKCNPESDWAIIAVSDEDDEYDVVRAPPTVV